MAPRRGVAGLLIGLAGCASEGALLERVNLANQRCHPHETVITGITEVGELSGVVEAFGMGEPDLPNMRGRGPIEGVELVLRQLGASGVVASTWTGPAGEFRLPKVTRGLYQLETCFAGWDAVVLVVRVLPGTSAPPLRLVISPSA